MADIKAIAEELVNLTVKEVNELATVLKEEYGIEPAAAAVAVAAGPAAAGAADGGAAEKDSFDVVLAEVGANKLAVVKAVKEACGLGLKDAKDVFAHARLSLGKAPLIDVRTLPVMSGLDKNNYVPEKSSHNIVVAPVVEQVCSLVETNTPYFII